MSNTFEWNDEYVKQFVAEVISGRHDSCQSAIDKFKESKQPKPEFEILVINSGVLMYEKSKNVFINGSHHVTIEWALDNEFAIYSVKRLSDNEVFTVGDKVWPYLTIKGFYLPIKGEARYEEGCTLAAYFGEPNANYCIHDLKKRPILFRTEDGVNIYEGDEYWAISDDYKTLWTNHARKTYSLAKIRAFSKKEKAEEWVLQNKPILSFNDLGGLGVEHQEYIMGIIKSKIKQVDFQ